MVRFEDIDFGNPLDEDFWNEWKDSLDLYIIFGGLSALMLVFLAATMPQVPNFAPAVIYMFYLALGTIFGTFDYLYPHMKLASFNFVGDRVERVFLAFVIGAIAFILYLIFLYPHLASGAIAVPQIGAAAAIAGISTTLIFVVFVAPYAEEKFYRMTVQPIFQNILNFGFVHNTFVAGWLANFGQAGLFAYAHFYITGGATDVMFELFVFGFIAGLLNQICKSSYAGFGFHLMRNTIAYAGMS